jgi:hypothetical protein
LFGVANLVDEPPHFARGATNPTTVVYKGDQSRWLSILWREVNGMQRAWAIEICSQSDSKKQCLWHTQNGITTYTPLRQLEKLNGKPFVLMGIGWDFSGTVVSWEGGKLDRPQPTGGLTLRLYPTSDAEISPEERKQITGEIQIPSSHPVLQKLNPQVYAMENDFP